MNPSIKFIARMRMSWGKISIQKQLLLLGLTCVAGLVTFTAWVWVARAQHMIDDSVKQFGLALAHALARGGAEALQNTGNLEGLRYYILTERGHTPAIAYVVYCDKNGQVILNPNSEKDLEDVFPIWTQPLHRYEVPEVYESPTGYRSITNIAVLMRRNQQDLGICWVGLDNNSFTILGTPRETRYFLLTIFVLVGLLGAVGVWANYALINKPLRVLSRSASEIAAGRFGYQIPGQKAGREIDELVNAFNYMSSRLKLYDKHNVDNLMSERNKFISERNKLELVLMSIADGVVVCDRDNKVQIVNRAATTLFDKDAQEMLGKPLVFCTEGPDSPQICQVIQAFTDSYSPGNVGPIVQQVNILERVVRIHSAPILLNKEFLGSVMIMQDITKQAELERMKNEFMSNVSHELRTPITSIKSYVDTLCNHGEKLDPEIHREFLETIDNEADRLMYLVNDVLQLSRLEEADGDLDVCPMEIRRACETAIRSLKMMAKDRSIELFFASDENVPLVNINQESIERVVINLLTNAIKYTPNGGKVTVRVEHLIASREVGVHIEDTGIGIPEDCLEHVFDRFFRVEKKVHTIKGTGLGLTIVKKIIEKHGGRVDVKSSLGEGSTFSFILPVAPTTTEDVPIIELDYMHRDPRGETLLGEKTDKLVATADSEAKST
ncbi:MAG: cell wall metabolism sensor histidine kinase WalK [Candidatus Obscuribacterales bacterium]|nr:cell wall metabolism sensor histidine kinase WalK [Candidatus Obscuribacterales bacterium]